MLDSVHQEECRQDRSGLREEYSCTYSRGMSRPFPPYLQFRRRTENRVALAKNADSLTDGLLEIFGMLG